MGRFVKCCRIRKILFVAQICPIKRAEISCAPLDSAAVGTQADLEKRRSHVCFLGWFTSQSFAGAETQRKVKAALSTSVLHLRLIDAALWLRKQNELTSFRKQPHCREEVCPPLARRRNSGLSVLRLSGHHFTACELRFAATAQSRTTSICSAVHLRVLAFNRLMS